VPEGFKLYQNYPNPFNPVTKIKFSIPSPYKELVQNIKLVIYDILGREAATLVNEPLQPGVYETEFDGTNYASGVYFYSLKYGDYYQATKMILLK
jgi:hypothetical protein